LCFIKVRFKEWVEIVKRTMIEKEKDPALVKIGMEKRERINLNL